MSTTTENLTLTNHAAGATGSHLPEEPETKIYDYTARSITGTTHKGYVEAFNEESARSLITASGMEPMTIKASTSRRARRRKWGDKQMADFCEQLRTRLRTGIKPAQAISQIAKTTTHPKLKRALREVSYDILSNGLTFAEALRRHPEMFSENFCNSVEIGSSAGKLVRTLELYRDNSARTATARALARKATRYPTFVGIFALLAITVLLYTFVPAMEGVLQALQGELPLPTRIVLFAGNTIASVWGLLIFAAIAGIVIFIKKQLKGPWKESWQRKQLELPYIGPLMRHYHAAQVCRYIAMLQASGYKIARCLEETARATTNIVFKEMLFHATEAITTEGVSPREALTPFARYLGYNIGSILATAEVDGSYDHHLGTHADELDNHVTEELEKLTEMIPTLAIGFLGITVGGVIISLYLPMFQIIGQLSNHK